MNLDTQYVVEKKKENEYISIIMYEYKNFFKNLNSIVIIIRQEDIVQPMYFLEKAFERKMRSVFEAAKRKDMVLSGTCNIVLLK